MVFMLTLGSSCHMRRRRALMRLSRFQALLKYTGKPPAFEVRQARRQSCSPSRRRPRSDVDLSRGHLGMEGDHWPPSHPRNLLPTLRGHDDLPFLWNSLFSKLIISRAREDAVCPYNDYSIAKPDSSRRFAILLPMPG
jgi:hypothetical protein